MRAKLLKWLYSHARMQAVLAVAFVVGAWGVSVPLA